jgi:sulfonate transport system permease protein
MSFAAFNPLKRDWRGAVPPLAFLLLWYAAARAGWVNTKLIVPPAAVLQSAYQSVTSGDFVPALLASLKRDLLGFLAGSLAGIAFGLLIGVSRWAERLFGPTFHGLRQISLFAWIPLISVWLGYNDQSRILFIALSAFYPVVLSTVEGVRSVTRAQLEVARVYRFTRRQILGRLILPAAAPQLATGLHLALVYAWLATIGAEFLLPSYGAVGLGDTVIKGRAAFRVDLVIVGMLVIGLTGYLLNRLALRLEARALVWRAPAR